jgi:hypothetical protein
MAILLRWGALQDVDEGQTHPHPHLSMLYGVALRSEKTRSTVQTAVDFDPSSFPRFNTSRDPLLDPSPHPPHPALSRMSSLTPQACASQSIPS